MPRALTVSVVLMLVCGIGLRLFPILGSPDTLAQTYMTEDGYLMLTIARNMAIGLGMTVSDGTIATNGVQPFATFLFALAYLATGGDKLAGLIHIHLISAAIGLAAVFALRAFAARCLSPHDRNPLWPWLAAALWFLSPLLLAHSMNALETGLYTLMILVTLLQFHRVLDLGTALPARQSLLLGALCGLTFLSRNDAVFLLVAIFSTWGLHALVALRMSLGAVLARLVPAGLLSVLISLPWLVNNAVKFGSIVPISGSAQSIDAGLGDNAPLLSGKIFELLFPMLPVPGGLETQAPVILGLGVVALVTIFWAARRVYRCGGTIALVMAAYAGHGVALALYYGFFFGAAHFLSRYLAPIAPLLIVATLIVLLDLAKRLAGVRAQRVVAGVGLASLALCLVLVGAKLLRGEQGHFQVVGWVQENVPKGTWVGAIQTGTLGYWHDRTINLDGKVNPEALAARRADGDVLTYVLDSPITYLADWHGIATWADGRNPGFSEAFELIVDRPDENLAVLRRRE